VYDEGNYANLYKLIIFLIDDDCKLLLNVYIFFILYGDLISSI
jgi:hypothetical protein